MMGHTLLPHNHSNNQDKQLVTENITHTLSGIIKDILSQNLGKDHLENIQKPSHLCKDIEIDIFTFKILSCETAENKPQSVSILMQIIRELETHYRTLKLRGPPLV